MKRVERADPRVLAENVRDDAADALRGYDRSPEATPSTHLWRGALPTALAVGEHTVEVRATPADRAIQRQHRVSPANRYAVRQLTMTVPKSPSPTRRRCSEGEDEGARNA